MNKTQEFINVNEDHWECLCGNDTMDIGFFPCDNKGDCKEPDSSWEGLYSCQKCGRIIEPETYKVIGINSNAKKYDDFIKAPF